MEDSGDYHELTDVNLATLTSNWEKWDKLAVTKCIKEIKPNHVKNLSDSVKILKFTNLNTFKNLKTLLLNLSNCTTLIFYDACFDKLQRNSLEKMVFHENITQVFIYTSTAISVKEHWIIEFLMTEVNFLNLMSLRMQKLYSPVPVNGEVEEIVSKYSSQIDGNLVTKFILKNRHSLKELELGGPGLKITSDVDVPQVGKASAPSNIIHYDQYVMTELTVYQSSASQYDQYIASNANTSFQDQEENPRTNTLADQSHHSRPLEKFMAKIKARKNTEKSREAPATTNGRTSNGKDNEIETNTLSLLKSSPSKKLFQSDAKDEGHRSSTFPHTSEGNKLVPEARPTQISPKEKLQIIQNEQPAKSGEKDHNSKAMPDIEKLRTLILEKFIFSFDSPAPALKSILESQQHLRVLQCTHIFSLQGFTSLDTTVQTVMSGVMKCIKNCANTLVEVTLDPTMVCDASSETLKNTDFLKNFQIDADSFANCSSLEILRLGLHSFRSVSDVGMSAEATLMGTRIISMPRIPAFQLTELSLSLEDYSKDEFEKFAKNFASLVKLKTFYLGTSTLRSENTFLARHDYLSKLFHLPVIETVIFHNARLENPEATKVLIDSYPNGAVITISFDYQRITFRFER